MKYTWNKFNTHIACKYRQSYEKVSEMKNITNLIETSNIFHKVLHLFTEAFFFCILGM